MRRLRNLAITAATLLAYAHSTVSAQTPGPNYVPTRFDIYSATEDLWRTDGGFQSTIRLTNVLAIAPIDVGVTLYMADGTPYPLPSVHLGASGTATVNINASLSVAPPSLSGHLSQSGTATFQYRYDWAGAVLGSVSILDTVRSLQFVSQFVFADSTMTAAAAPGAQNMIEGMWWQYSPATRVYLSVANPTDVTANADIAVVSQVGQPLGTRHFSLAPHASTLSSLNDLIGAGTNTTQGGIEISYAGAPHSLLFSGNIEDDAVGYSAQLRLSMSMTGTPPTSSGTPSSCTVASAGLMVGKPDPMEGFPSAVAFSLYGFARNTGASPLTLHTLVNYMDSSGPHSIPLPDQALQAGETRNLGLVPTVPLPFQDGSVNLSFTYNGPCGSLLLTTGSVDSTGSYVFDVEPEGVGQSWGRISHFWQATAGTDTMYSVWNLSSQAEDLVATFYYGQGGGLYSYPLHLEPNTSAMISVLELIMKGAPDVNGNVFPATAKMGSMTIGNRDPDLRHMVTFALSSGTYNPVAGTCCGNPFTCNGATGANTSPASATVPVAHQEGLQFYVTQSTGGQTNYTSSASWSSGNTSVATVSGGSVTGVYAGSTNISAGISGIPEYVAQMCPPATCPSGNQGAQTQTGVVPVVSLTVTPTSLTVAKVSGSGSFTVDASAGGSFSGTISGSMTVSAPSNPSQVSLTEGSSTQTYDFTLSAGGSTGATCVSPGAVNCFLIATSATNANTGTITYTVTLNPSATYSVGGGTSPKQVVVTVQ